MKSQFAKLLIFVVLLGAFYAFGGFDRPTVASDSYHHSGRMARAWIITVIMFLAGAVMTLWGNALAQHVAWDIPDGLYPLIGGLLLVAGFIWMLMVRDAIRA